MTSPAVRVGLGHDTHRLGPDRALILGGVEVPYELGLVGHSDADVLLHANAHHMAVAREPLPQAIERIAAQGDGPVTAHRRVEKELK